MLGLKYLSEKDWDSCVQDHEPSDVLNSPGRIMEADEEVKMANASPFTLWTSLCSQILG